MTTSCPIPSPAEQQVVDIIEHAEKTMLAVVFAALEDAARQAAEGMQRVASQEEPPAYEYFAAVLHQHMYCVMCGANPDTLEGGDPRIAVGVIRNSQNIAKHYWGADIEPYPSEQP